MDVYIDVGHSADSPGAIGYDGRTEHAEGLELANLLAPELRALGISYSMDLSGNDPAFRGSVNKANAVGAKLAIELHRDWRGGIDSCFGLYVSTQGRELARHLTEELGARGLPIWRDGTINEDEIGRHGLAFLNDTTMPAVILELGRIRDFPIARNRVEAKGIAAGIAGMLGKPTTPRPRRVNEHRDVAIGAVRRPDTELAAGLAWAHAFAYVEPLPNGKWLQTYPSGKEVMIDSIGYLVGVGYQADQLVSTVDDGVVIAEGTARETAIEVARLIRDVKDANRERPFRS